MVYLNKELKFSCENDLAQAEENINKIVAEGWSFSKLFLPLMV